MGFGDYGRKENYMSEPSRPAVVDKQAGENGPLGLHTAFPCLALPARGQRGRACRVVSGDGVSLCAAPLRGVRRGDVGCGGCPEVAAVERRIKRPGG